MQSCDLTKDLAAELKSGNKQIYVLVIGTLQFHVIWPFWILSSGWLVFYYFPTVLLKDTELELSRWFSNSSEHLSCRPKTSPKYARPLGGNERYARYQRRTFCARTFLYRSGLQLVGIKRKVRKQAVKSKHVNVIAE